eukprot:1193342-Prorocentrum_minimum.AAC.3
MVARESSGHAICLFTAHDRARLICARAPAPTSRVGAREGGLVAQILLYAKQLVVLGQALGAAGGPRLDLPAGQPNGQVRQKGVLRLACTNGYTNVTNVTRPTHKCHARVALTNNRR